MLWEWYKQVQPDGVMVPKRCYGRHIYIFVVIESWV